jgi:V8-like Glu-specific endopeptidase/endonuclease/exonuclease/phosphatase family metal-dependent hydrolase
MKVKKRSNLKKNSQLCPGKERLVKNTKKLDATLYRRLVARRARQLVDPTLSLPMNEKNRKKYENDIEKKFLEKIHLVKDFLPARFLVDGASRSNAVCRIVTSTSLGTGFLIGRSFLMTNNHVLADKEEAEGSVAEFGFEEGEDITRVAIEPGRLFITDKNLDFTIVACDGRNISDIKPIQLLRNPSTVTRNERVNIIQHPKGLPKKVALHDNKVILIKDKVVHYHTDTEPGSSGSPVFNNKWDLVALHHAGWSVGGGRSTNEGVRISAIVSHLLRRSNETSADREGAEAILRSVTDTSPYLGFFDYNGVGDLGSLEVEVPDFTGTKDFADVGFWNIEHFNNSVSNRRINDVADVIERLSMDVLGLVEVQSEALDRLVSNLGGRGSSLGYEYLNVRGSQDIAVLYDRDTTKVKNRKDIAERHKRRLNAKTPSGKTAFPRHPLFVECHVEDGNNQESRFIIIVVHLKAFGDAQSRVRRRLASDILAEIIDDVREREDIPVVLGGDFNEKLDNQVLSALKTSPDLFSLTLDDASTDAISYIGRRYRSLIDHIIVSRDAQMGTISGDDAAIVRLDRSVRDFADRVSDHVPIVFRMIYRDNGINVGPPVPAPSAPVNIPEGATKVRLDFD